MAEHAYLVLRLEDNGPGDSGLQEGSRWVTVGVYDAGFPKGAVERSGAVGHLLVIGEQAGLGTADRFEVAPHRQLIVTEERMGLVDALPAPDIAAGPSPVVEGAAGEGTG